MAEQYYTLGLDIGIGSCGWALLDMSEGRIVDLGVRLWDVPQEPKTKESTATTRRNARSARRNTKRTADRKKHCLKLLKQEGLVPEDASAQWMQTTKGDKPTLALRDRGLSRQLNDREWAQVLYSLCCRRGYIPHGEGSDDVEGKKVLKAIQDNTEALKKEGWRTVGEMLAHQDRSRNRGGDYVNCVSNAQIIDEVNTLFEFQKKYGNEHTSDSFKSQYLDCLTWQKDVTDYDERIYQQVGECSYFPHEVRAAKACLSFEMCSAFERLGHAIIVDRDGQESHLPAKVRKQAIETLFSPVPINKNKECKVRYKDIRKWCDLDADSFFKGVEHDSEKDTEVFKPTCWRNQRKNLPKTLMLRMRENREFADEIDSALTYSSSRKSLEKQLEEIDLNEEEREALMQLNFTSRMYKGYGSRSLKALNLLLDSFDSFNEQEEIVTLYDAEEASGLADLRLYGEKEKSDRLPPYNCFDKTCKNPVVLRVMGQVRKIVNAISKEYGVPGEIHIELARELKHSVAEKKRITEANKRTKTGRDAARKTLAECLHCEEEAVPAKLLRKYELWQEQKYQDLYTGKPIECERLISDDQYCQIDHILPYSRTYDDSQMNKVLVLQKSNQDKREQTPYEWLAPQGLWEDFKLRIARLEHYPRRKRENFLVENLDEEKSGKYLERNLNDTRYASRSTKQYIEQYLEFPDTGRKKHVVAVAAGATVALRNAWGIHKVRSEDNVHHAIDAAVIAACDESTVKAVAHAMANKAYTPKDERKALFSRSEPWDGFTEELYEWRKNIYPTRMANHGVTGRAFEDTLYRFEGLNEKGTKGVLSVKGESGARASKVSSNYVRNEDGSAEIVDGLAFLRLWWDPDAPVRGRKDKPGRYFAEPVYYADIPAVMRGDYIPRMVPPQTGRKPRELWDEIPKDLSEQDPVVLYSGDAVFLSGAVRRFAGFGIDTNTWDLEDLRGETTNLEATKGLPYSSIGPDDQFFVVQEDPLGHCFRKLLED